MNKQIEDAKRILANLSERFEANLTKMSNCRDSALLQKLLSENMDLDDRIGRLRFIFDI